MTQTEPPKDKYTVGKTLYGGAYRPVAIAANPLAPPVEKQPSRIAARVKLGLILLLIIILIPFSIFVTWNYKNYSAASKKMFGSGNLFSALVPSSAAGAERGRTNILIVGYSADDPGHAGAKLTDSLMIVSLGAEGKQSYMLSIPRDLYVEIPDYGRAKINEAYQNGENDEFSESGLPSGGIGLLQKTITKNLGVPVDYYAVVNYAAVRDTTDALGGITVNIQSTDPRGIHDPNFKPEEGGPLTLANGPQKIDGATALRLTRARGAAGGYGLALSDFDRTKNQQAVIAGIKNGISTNLLINPMKNEAILNAGANNITTNIELNEMLPLYKLFSKIPTEQLKPVSLRDFNGENLLSGFVTSSGQSALVPAAGVRDFSEIQEAISKLNK